MHKHARRKGETRDSAAASNARETSHVLYDLRVYRDDHFLDTIFQGLKLAQHQADKSGMYQGNKSLSQSFGEADRGRYHVVLDLTRAQYETFVKRVSYGRCCYGYALFTYALYTSSRMRSPSSLKYCSTEFTSHSTSAGSHHMAN
jgi:hypothetical protein